jgi:uncharacterized protein YlaI
MIVITMEADMQAHRTHSHTTAKCWKCHQTLHSRVRRHALIKAFLFWLPIRAYFCPKCAKRRYVLVHKHAYEPAPRPKRANASKQVSAS